MAYLYKNKSQNTKVMDSIGIRKEVKDTNKGMPSSSRSNGTSNLNSLGHTISLPSRDVTKGVKTNGSLSNSCNKNPSLKFQRPGSIFEKNSIFQNSNQQNCGQQKLLNEDKTNLTPRSQMRTNPLHATHQSLTRSLPRTKLGTGQTPSTPNLGTPRNTKRGSSPKKIRKSTLALPDEDVHTTIKITRNLSSPCSARKSYGSSQKSVRIESRRFSYNRRKSSFHCPYYNSPSLPNTPISSSKLYSHHRNWTTPREQQRRMDLLRQSTDIDPQQLESSRVSVGVRVRPLSSIEMRDSRVRNIINIEGNEIEVTDPSTFFTYDHCLWSVDGATSNFASQQTVYETQAKPLLIHAMKGYNVCLFAYGQTGSGKSYTIMGGDKNISKITDETGVIPRFCKDLFQKITDIKVDTDVSTNLKCKVMAEVGFIEIYQEKIYDLLGCFCDNFNEENHVCSSGDWEKRVALRRRQHPQTGPFVEGQLWHSVASYEDLHMWISLGNTRRTIAATEKNMESSRSHSIFSIKITQTQVETIEGEEMKNCIVSNVNIVDLAGSERIAASNPEEKRLREGVSINQSLLTLGKVITALAEGEKPTCYRESALTFLLQESLGGNSKTSMIATISPCNIHREETLSTLRYAQKTRKIVNFNQINEDPEYRVIRKLKFDLERYREQMKEEEVLKLNLDREPDESLEKIKDKESEAVKQAEEAKIALLQDQLKKLQENYYERDLFWEQKYEAAEKKQKETEASLLERGLSLKKEENQPVLVQLMEDEQFSETLLFNLKKDGVTTLGKNNTDIIITSLIDPDIHCSFVATGDKLVVRPTGKTYLNGDLVTEETDLFHDDRIVVSSGRYHYFRVSFSRNKRSKLVINFRFAKDELQQRLRSEMKIKDLIEQNELLSEKAELEFQLRTQLELRVSDMELESEKEKYKPNLSPLNESSFILGEASILNDQLGSFLNQSAFLHQSVESTTKFSHSEVELRINLEEANNICTNLVLPYLFKVHKISDSIECKVEICHSDPESHDTTAIISQKSFSNCFADLNDIEYGNVSVEDFKLYMKKNLPWNRTETSSQVTVFKNRLSLNGSLNASSLDSSVLGWCSRTNRSNRRKSFLNQSNASILNIGAPSSTVMSEVKRLMAQELGSLPSAAGSSAMEKTVHSLIGISDLVKSIVHLNKDSLMTDELCAKMLRLMTTAHLSSQCLGRVADLKTLHSSGQVADMQRDIAASADDLCTKIMALIEAFDKYSEAVLESLEEDVLKHLSETVGQLALFNVISGLPLLQAHAFNANDSIRQSYLSGISLALEAQVKRSASVAENLSSVIEVASENNESLLVKICKEGVKAMTRTALFLDKYSLLKVQPTAADERNPALNSETQRLLCRVSDARDNILQLNSTLSQLRGEFKLLNQGLPETGCLESSLSALQECLGELVDSAGIGSTMNKNSLDETDVVDQFLLQLHDSAMKSFRSLNSLSNSVWNLRDSGTLSSPSKADAAAVGSFKSALKRDSKKGEVRKVRFDVSLEVTEKSFALKDLTNEHKVTEV